MFLTIKHEVETKTQSDKDSYELGTPSKNGVIKIYMDFNKPEECKAKIDKAYEIREYALKKLKGTTD